MFNTRITDLLGIQYPIIQGGLQGVGTSPLVSAVSASGGLGLLTAGSFTSKRAMIEDIEQVRAKTDQPFGVNIAIGIRRPMDEFVDGVIEANVPIVFTSGANPVKFMPLFKKAGTKVVHVVPSIRFAKKAEAMGCDAVAILGYEGAGHPGLADNTSVSLIPRAAKELSIPVIAAGGFSNGDGLVAALSLGAEAIQMGTRFLATKEAPIHESIKRKIIDLQETDTMIIKRSINKPMRVMKTEAAEMVLTLERAGASVEELIPYIGAESNRKLIETGDLNTGVISLGQGVGVINEVVSVKEIIDQIMKDASRRITKLTMFLDQWPCVGR